MISSTPAARAPASARPSWAARPAASTMRRTRPQPRRVAAGPRPPPRASWRPPRASSPGSSAGSDCWASQPSPTRPARSQRGGRVAPDEQWKRPGRSGKAEHPRRQDIALGGRAGGPSRPAVARDRDPLLEPRPAPLERDAERLELLRQPAGADAELEAAAARDVDRGGLLGEFDGVAQRQHEHGGAELDAPVSRRRQREGDERVEVGRLGRPGRLPVRREGIERADRRPASRCGRSPRASRSPPPRASRRERGRRRAAAAGRCWEASRRCAGSSRPRACPGQRPLRGRALRCRDTCSRGTRRSRGASPRVRARTA